MESAQTDIEVPGWVPPEHRGGYRQIAVEAGEEEAAAWARVEKQGGWAQEQVGRLRSLWELGLAPSRIAADLGVSPAAVRGKLHNLGIHNEGGSSKGSGPRSTDPYPNVDNGGWTSDRVEKLRHLWRQGLSAGAISVELGGISRSAVIGKLHRLGLKSEDQPAYRGALCARDSVLASPPPLPAGDRPEKAPTGLKSDRAAPVAGTPERPSHQPPNKALPVSREGENQVGVDIMALKICHCRWIVSGTGAHARYCGQSRPNPKRPYCEFHEAVATGSRAAAE